MAMSDAASAVCADIRIDFSNAVDHLDSIDGTGVNDAALFATVSFFFVKLGNQLPDDSNIIQIWLYTVVWTSAHGDFELVR